MAKLAIYMNEAGKSVLHRSGQLSGLWQESAKDLMSPHLSTFRTVSRATEGATISPELR
jgi:hypothetical protein